MMIATAHAQQRCRERFGIDPSEREWGLVVLAITDRPPRAILLALDETREPPVERWLVELCGVELVIAWVPTEAVVRAVMKRSECAGRVVSGAKRASLHPAFRGARNSPERRPALRLARDIAEAAE